MDLSARGIAIDTALPSPEEFPRFTEFFVERDGSAVNVYAVLDGPSITGAYRIHCRKEGIVTTEVDARLFARTDIKRLGIAPLTSMFWYSELNRAGAPDWRPEVHDSDGLALWTGSGERLWRPLNNPNRVMTSSFSDRAPKGFGLLQRDRSFSDYEDDGVFYERRPSVWVEPMGDWGDGAVQLVEIPTDAEIHDNIVAYWVPAQPVRGGDTLAYRYRVYWTKDAPFLPKTGQVVASRRGRGGRPAEVDKLGLVKYAVDFEGGDLATFESGDPIEPVVTVSRGEVLNAYALRVNTTEQMAGDLRPQGGWNRAGRNAGLPAQEDRGTRHRNLARTASAGGGVACSPVRCFGNIFVVNPTDLLHTARMNSSQAKRYLARHGCTFEPGKGGHLLVRRGERKSVLPMHGGSKELGKGLWLKILKDLGLKDE